MNQPLTGSPRRLRRPISVLGPIASPIRGPIGGRAAAAQVEIRGQRSMLHERSDSKGRFRANGVDEGELWLRATHGELTSTWTSAHVLTGSVTSVELLLVPGGRLTVEVEDASGRVEKAFVSLKTGSELVGLVLLVHDGKGTQSAVPPGTYAVVARRDYRDRDGPKAEATLTVLSGGEHVLRLRLP
jgi:hypothetical protein